MIQFWWRRCARERPHEIDAQVLQSSDESRSDSGLGGEAHAVRRDVQGLRAFAVMAVVANHVLGNPASGYVGVDIFFVISGFLITGLLVREYERDGRVSFMRFYVKRVRRIMPAALLVIVVTVVASQVVLSRARFDEITSDGVWAIGFAANWRFMIQSTDYFNTNGPVSPLQHYWSLSIEEQFYFIWPAVLVAVLTLYARILGRRSSRPGSDALCWPQHFLFFYWLLWRGLAN